MSLYTHAAVAIAGAALAASGTWWVQARRYDARISDMQRDAAVQLADAVDLARKTEQAHMNRYRGALNAARLRETDLRRNVAGARAESDGLREQLSDATSRIATASAGAVAEYAAAANLVFADCSRAYQGLAAEADGHVDDVRTLIEAWPVNPSRLDGGSTGGNP